MAAAVVAAACTGDDGASSPTTLAGSTTSIAAAASSTSVAPDDASTTTSTSVPTGLLARLQLTALGMPERSCLVVHRNGIEVISLRPTTPLAPASTVKLLTAAGALDLLGSAHRSRTAVLRAGDDLVLVGGGDPLLGTEGYANRFDPPLSPRTSLETLADRVVAAGITSVAGAVVGDGTRYDDLRVVPSWPDRYRTQGVVGPLGGLVVDDGFVAGLDGSLQPAGDPAVAAAEAFTRLLAARGVSVAGAPRAGTAAPGAVEVASIESAPLREVVTEMLKSSDNGTAELIAKEVGKVVAGRGTTADGVGAISSRLVTLGLPMDQVQLRDGSGLDPSDRVTCAALVAVLERSGPTGDIGQGLSVAGIDGTLRQRFAKTALQGRFSAKSGSIDGVVSLAGLVPEPTRSGTYTFAIVVNDPDADAARRAWWYVAGALAELPVDSPVPWDQPAEPPSDPEITDPGVAPDPTTP